MAELDPTPAEALGELHDILLLTALETSPPRQAAQHYILCRDILLRSHLRRTLPGFLQQCLTVDKLHDFIHLYHAALEARVAFIDGALEESLKLARARSRTDAFGDRREPA